MGRINNKKQLFDYENSIKKSNELSMAKLSYGLTLNQMQLLAYAIYCTQKNGKTEFNKADFEKKFGIEKYQTVHAKEDVPRLKEVKAELLAVVDEKNNIVDYESFLIFRRIRYDNGLFTFKWDNEIVPHIIDLKERYVITDLTITAKFKSSFSWTLYDYLRAHYGYWHKPISKDSLMKLFGVEDKKTYITNTGKFKQAVLDVAIAEINEYTELEVWYKEEKQGRKITGFDIHWSSGRKVKSATKKQIRELKMIVDAILDDQFEFVNLNNAKDRESAINIVRKVEEMKIHTVEPICITYEAADRLLHQAIDGHRMLVTMLKKEKGERDRSFYYNWLEE